MKRLIALAFLTTGLVVVGMSQPSQAGHGGCRCGHSHRSYGNYYGYNSFRYYSPPSYGYGGYNYYRPYSGISFGSSRFNFSFGSGYSPSYYRYGSRRYWGCR